MNQISLKPRPFPEHWRHLAEYWKVSQKGKQRLEWLIFYYTVGKQNALATASYFGISPKTLHKWKRQFNPSLIQSLEEKSKAPHKRREWQVSKVQEERIISLRERHLKYGKAKLKILYQKQYQEEISTWKIERVIRKHKLFPDLEEYHKQVKRKKIMVKKPKIRINKLKEFGFAPLPGKLWHTDSIEIWWYGQRRIIFTALEDQTKLGYARVYKSSVSHNAADFLKRLVYLSDGDIRIIHSDNGAEFEKDFTKACEELKIQQIYSRVKTPKDNPCLERFNWTVQDEWLSQSEVGLDEITEANRDLTEWLIEYNSIRPHETLDYQTPIEYASKKYFQVLPMWPASTKPSTS